MFISATRLVQYGDLVGGVRTLLSPPVTVRTWNNVVYQTVAEAVAALPAGQRPAASDYWKYVLQWQVDAYALPRVRGVVPGTGMLVFDADLWPSITDAGTPPVARNTFIYQFTSSRVTGNVGQDLRGAITDWLLRAGLAGWTGDRRDPRVATSTNAADDPLGLLASSAVQGFDNQGINLASAWRPVIG